MSLDPHALKIYIDGSSLKNPGGAGGLAAWIEYPADWGREDELLFEEGYQGTTNNRMELMACIHAFEHVRQEGGNLGVERVQIVTDSRYVQEGSLLADRWRKNSWRGADDKPIENRDLWERFLSIRSKLGVRTDLQRLLGKRSPILKAVDKSAKAASAAPWNVDRGFKPGQVGRSIGRTGRAASLFAARGQKAVIRIYRTRLVGRVDHKFYFEVLNEESGKVIEKACAFASAEVALELHRQHSYCVLFNADPKFPIIERIVLEVSKSR